MKKLIAFALVTVGISLSARAQWIVYDPVNNAQQILSAAEDIAKYIQMIENQVQQIQTLTDQLNEFKHYEDLFGDPKSVLLSTVQPLIGDLKKTELGQTLTTLESTISTTDAMLYNASGLFESIGTTFSAYALSPLLIGCDSSAAFRWRSLSDEHRRCAALAAWLGRRCAHHAGNSRFHDRSRFQIH